MQTCLSSWDTCLEVKLMQQGYHPFCLQLALPNCRLTYIIKLALAPIPLTTNLRARPVARGLHDGAAVEQAARAAPRPPQAHLSQSLCTWRRRPAQGPQVILQNGLESEGGFTVRPSGPALSHSRQVCRTCLSAPAGASPGPAFRKEQGPPPGLRGVLCAGSKAPPAPTSALAPASDSALLHAVSLFSLWLKLS